MKIGIPKEIVANENRVALTPESVGKLVKSGLEVLVETNAGLNAAFTDEAYTNAGARIVPEAAALYGESDLVCKVQKPVLNEATGKHEIDLMSPGTSLVAFLQPLTNPELVGRLAQARITSFSMDAIPRITRAQSMDALSSMSTVAGYKAVLLASVASGRFFPLLMTAAGTIPPAKVFVLGAGVAGLMAIATAKRLGAVVEGFDIRPAVREEVQSLGATFVGPETALADAETAGSGGYAREVSDDFQARERELLGGHVAAADCVIATAMVPDRAAPRLVTEETVDGTRPGSVVVDLA